MIISIRITIINLLSGRRIPSEITHRRHHHSITHYRATFKSGKGTPLFTPLFTHSTTPPLHFTGEPAHFSTLQLGYWTGLEQLWWNKVFKLDFITRRVFLVTSERKELITGLLVQSTLTDTSSVQRTKNRETLHTNFLVGVGFHADKYARRVQSYPFLFPIVSPQSSEESFGLWTSGIESSFSTMFPFVETKAGDTVPVLRFDTHHVCESRLHDKTIMTMTSWFCFYVSLTFFFPFLLWAKLCIFTNIRIRKRKEKLFH